MSWRVTAPGARHTVRSFPARSRLKILVWLPDSSAAANQISFAGVQARAHQSLNGRLSVTSLPDLLNTFTVNADGTRMSKKATYSPDGEALGPAKTPRCPMMDPSARTWPAGYSIVLLGPSSRTTAISPS